MFSSLQSRYESQGYETNLNSEDRYVRLSITSDDSDSWVIVSEEPPRGRLVVMFKENGSAGNPDEKEFPDDGELESVADRFVEKI